jgi:hypothetical protein
MTSINWDEIAEKNGWVLVPNMGYVDAKGLSEADLEEIQQVNEEELAGGEAIEDEGPVWTDDDSAEI